MLSISTGGVAASANAPATQAADTTTPPPLSQLTTDYTNLQSQLTQLQGQIHQAQQQGISTDYETVDAQTIANSIPIGESYLQQVQPEDWSKTIVGGANATYSVDTTTAHSGQSSLKITDASPLQGNIYIVVGQSVAVQPNTTYSFSAWVKAQDASGVSAILSPDWTQQEVMIGTNSTETFDWTQFNWQYTTAANQTAFNYYILVQASTQAVWFDDLTMTAAGSNTNLLSNPGFEEASYPVAAWDIYQDLQQLDQQASADLQAYLAGTEKSPSVPRYVTSPVTVSGRSLISEQSTGTGAATRGKSIFTGYLLNDATESLSDLQSLGSNTVETELGPDNIIFPPNQPIGWTEAVNGDANATYRLDTSTEHSGKASLKMTDASAAAANVNATVGQTVTVQPNTTYTLSAWVRADDASGVTIGSEAVPAGTYGWQRLTWQYTTGATQTSYTLNIVVAGVTSAVWFDDVSVSAPGSAGNLLTDPGFEQGLAKPGVPFAVDTSYVTQTILPRLRAAANDNQTMELLLSPHDFPAWALAKYPGLNIPNPFFITFDINNPIARQIIKAYIQAVVPLIKNSPSLGSLILANEPVYWNSSTSLYTQQMWHAYLQKTYGTIAQLNTIYGSSYTAFTDVPIPTSDIEANDVTPTPYMYDWITFNDQQFAAWFSWMAGLVHQIAPKLPLDVKVNPNTVGLTTQVSLLYGVDPQAIAQVSQINGDDGGLAEFDYSQTMQLYDLQASLADEPIFNLETHPIVDNNQTWNDPTQVNNVQLGLWGGAINGVVGNDIWLDAANWSGYTEIMAHPGLVAAVGHTSLDLDRLANQVSAFQNDPAHVALLWSIPSDVYSTSYLTAVNNAYNALTESGVKVSFISEDQIKAGDFANDKLLVVPEATHVEPSTLAGIAQFEARGGQVVVLGSDSLAADPHNQPLSSTLRSSVLSGATVLSGTDSGTQLQADLAPDLAKIPQIAPLQVIDTSTGQPDENIEWRSVTYEGHLLVYLANLSGSTQQVTIMSHGQPLTLAADLINRTTLQGSTLSLAPDSPNLIEVAGA